MKLFFLLCAAGFAFVISRNSNAGECLKIDSTYRIVGPLTISQIER